MPDSTKAVFLSYASQDAPAARRICESLRAAGIEVWFDQSELRGGDAWDQAIRRQIHDCALFVPIVSTHTDARTEGYFRLEWKLAVDRSHLMADDAAFLFPVVIDDTTEQAARVPDKFRTVQWTRMPDGIAPPNFAKHVAALLAGSEAPARARDREVARPHHLAARWAKWGTVLGVAAIAAGLWGWWIAHRASPAEPAPTQPAAAAASSAPAHSIAVLPFVNASGTPGQDYFSDGLAEELLNLLSKVPGLQVAARTSAFSFKGKDVDIGTIGRKLMVANVLEGSVRRSGSHLRISAQLMRTDSGYEVWSGVYDREIGDVFRLQDEIATSVAKALKLTLLGNATPHGPSTRSADTYLVFLKGRAKMASERMADIRSAAGDFSQVIKLDPDYAPAYVELAAAKVRLAEFDVTGERQAAFGTAVEQAKLLLERALALDPRNAQAYLERGYLRAFTDLKGAEQDYRRGIQLDPNSARGYEGLATVVYEDPRRRDESLTLLTKASVLDPLDPKYDVLRATIMFFARSDPRGADALLSEVVARHPTYQPAVMRLADVRRGEGLLADAILYGEQALKLDPLSEWTRLSLIDSYVEVDAIDAAQAVVDSSPHWLPIERIRLLIRDGDWHRAAEISYAALANGTMLLVDEPWVLLAIRMDARATHDFRRARVALERQCGVTWSAQGIPTLPRQLGMPVASVGLADMLIASGERERADRLLRASLADMDYVARVLKRGDYWYLASRAIAVALSGDRKATIAALRKSVSAYNSTWLIGMDPTLKLVSDDPEYTTLLRDHANRIAQERQKLESLLADGRVPVRGRAADGAPGKP